MSSVSFLPSFFFNPPKVPSGCLGERSAAEQAGKQSKSAGRGCVGASRGMPGGGDEWSLLPWPARRRAARRGLGPDRLRAALEAGPERSQGDVQGEALI